MSIKKLKFLPSSIPDSEKGRRTIQSILENVIIVEETFQDYLAHGNNHKKRLEFVKQN